MSLFHKHLLVNARVKNPISSEEEGIGFLTRLVENIDMKILQGPFATYVDKPGNKGLTAIVLIETSHIAFHIWDEEDPGLIQFDLYTCGRLNLQAVIAMFYEAFNVIDIDYVLFDREKGFVKEASSEDGLSYAF